MDKRMTSDEALNESINVCTQLLKEESALTWKVNELRGELRAVELFLKGWK